MRFYDFSLPEITGAMKDGMFDPAIDLKLTWVLANRAHFPVDINRAPDAMRAEMPKKYWRNLPEAKLILCLIETAAARTSEMIASGPTTPNRRIMPYQPQAKTCPR